MMMHESWLGKSLNFMNITNDDPHNEFLTQSNQFHATEKQGPSVAIVTIIFNNKYIE